MKVAIILAVLVGIILQEAMGYDTCPKPCKKWQKYNCVTRYYYSYYSSTSYPYESCSWREIDGVCNETCLHGGWSNWSEYELSHDCPVMCGGARAHAVRTRSCNNPAPWNNGNMCIGADTDEAEIDCNVDACGGRCPRDQIKYHAHPENKHMFYQCDHGHKKAFLKNCTQGTVFSADHNTCVHASAHDSDCSSGEMTAHPFECGRFLRCLHGQFVEANCPPALHFNAQAKTCDWPVNAQCTVS